MDTSSIVLFFHVVVAFAAVAFLVIPGVMLEIAAHTHDVPFIRKAYGIGSFHGKIGGPLAILILPLGVAAAWTAGIPLGSGWLIVSYVTYAVVIAIGIGYHMRRELRIAALSQTSPDAAPSPELLAALDDPLNQPMLWISAILWIALIALMVAKPF
ncbi:MAG: DUF2269 family protein [Candidatus Eremiobacteraeota bacterium]|nr:DUF2269 family protein [Candidatus Eremiobacteraeota bacterium]